MRTATSTRRYTVGTDLFTRAAKCFWSWIAAAAVIAAVLPVVFLQFGSTVELSAWDFVAYIGKYLIAIVAGAYLYGQPANLIAKGFTRREIAGTFAVFGLLWSVSLGALAAAGFLAEHAYYGAFGWTQAVQRDTADLHLDSVGAVLEFALRYPLLYPLYFTAGALIGLAAYRWRRGGLIAFPVVAIVTALDDTLSWNEPLGRVWVQETTGFARDWGTLPSVGAVIAAALAGAWIVRRILIATPIRAKKA